VSETAHGYVEILYPDTEFVRDAAYVHFDALPPLHAVLAFPWGEHTEEDDQPPPIVPPRGFPENPGLLVLNRVAFYVDARGAKDPTNPRAITPKKAKKLQKLVVNGISYYLDPDVKCPTWLTRPEVEAASVRYFNHTHTPCFELHAVAAMMEQYERQKLGDGKRPMTRLVVWFT
jgi:hypothetical protein